MDLPLETDEKSLVQYLNGMGWNVYAVGGSVRDVVMGRKRGDLDIVVQAPFKDVVNRLRQRYRVLPDGLPYKIARTVLRAGENVVVDVSVPNNEIYPGLGERPVRFQVDTIEKDLGRRDFTINAMAIKLGNGSHVFDPFGGIHDIGNKVVRFVGDPYKRIEEDPLRILRALRFAATLGCSIETESASAIRNSVDKLGMVSGERIRDEILKASGNFSTFFEVVVSMGAAEMVFHIDAGRWASVIHDHRGGHYGESLLQHTIDNIRRLEEYEKITSESVSWEVKLAMLYHDSGKVASMERIGDKVTFHDHPKFSKAFTAPILKTLRLTVPQQNHVLFLIAGHMRFPKAEGQRESTMVKHIIDARMQHIPMKWLLDMVVMSKADNHVPPSPEFIRLMYEVEMPRGTSFLHLPPERRKDAVRSEWINRALAVYNATVERERVDISVSGV